MIQPEFAVKTQMCDGCDEETHSAVWFSSRSGRYTSVLCPTCISALMFTAMKHPNAERMVGPKR